MNYNENQRQRTSDASAPRRQPGDKDGAERLLASLQFILALPLTLIYLELVVRIAAFKEIGSSFFVYAIFFSIAGGMLMALFCTLFDRKVNYVITLVLLALPTILCSIQIVYSAFFGDFFALGMLGMAGNLADYMGNTIKAIFANLHWILILFIPFVLFAIFGRKVIAPERSSWMLRAVCAVLSVCFFMLGTLYVNKHDEAFGDKFVYREGFLVRDSIERFGVLTTARLELQYMIFGIPEADVGEIPDVLEGEITTAIQGVDIFGPKVTTSPETEPVSPPESGEVTGGSEVTGEVSGEQTTPTPPPPPVIDRSPQRLDIDFEKLIADAKAAGKNSLAKAHSFFASRAGTNKHEYTGYFEGKNLIYITVEGWAPAAINEKLTPTLYMMKNDGFVFNNYYCSLWGGSTATGEYANITGNFYYSADCFYKDKNAKTYQKFTLGNILPSLGYECHAFHNHGYDFYNRDMTHPNFGYDWHAVGNWDVPFTPAWPKSDYELAINSLPYLSLEEPFHLYYMTTSGHANQTFVGNRQAAKHKSLVMEVLGNDYKEELSLSFIACQYEVELMVKALYDECARLGILEDTVFVLAPDHFPYSLSEKTDGTNERALAEMYGLPVEDIYANFDLYRAPLVIWSASMEGPVEINKVCSAPDILPTILNLFGAEYDSRVIIGQDILDLNAEGFVILNTDKGYHNFVTDYGVFNFKTKKFIVAEGFSVDAAALETYVSQKRDYAYNLRTYSPYILDNDYYRILFPNG